MKQKKKYIIFLSIALVMVSSYIGLDQKIKNKYESKHDQLNVLNKELKFGLGLMDDIQDLRKYFIDNKEQLSTKKITGNELLQEVNRLNTLANSLSIDLKNLEIDPRNTFPDIEALSEENKINIARNSLNFRLHGNFLDIGTFLEMIEKNSSQLKLQFCSIGLDSLDPQGVIAEIEYLTYGGLEL